MYSKGDMIVYGSTGVCRVEDVGLPQHIPSDDKETLYYKLAPLYGAGYIFIPVTSKVVMRPVMSRQQAENLIDEIPGIEEEDTTGLDTRRLTEKYRSMLTNQDCCRLISLIKSVQKKARHAAACGKHTGKTDREYQKRALDLLHGELAVSLDMPVDKVGDYICSRLDLPQLVEC